MGSALNFSKNHLKRLGFAKAAALCLLVATSISSMSFAQGWELSICAEPNNLPFSNKALEGFENEIAEILADELGAEAVFVWIDPPLASNRDYLIQSGACDVLMAITDGHKNYLTTIAYYRTIFTFVSLSERDLDVESFDDPNLKNFRIGVQTSGGRGISPVTQALGARSLIPNQIGYVTDLAADNPLLALPQAVVDGDVDLAVVWGPVAGYAAARSTSPLTVTPVTPEIELPFLPMFQSITLGLRPGDEALRDELNVALTNRWEDVQKVLDDYGVPKLFLPSPGKQ